MKHTLFVLLTFFSLLGFAPAALVTLAWDDNLNQLADLAEYRIYRVDESVSGGAVLIDQVRPEEREAEVELPIGEHTLYIVAVDKTFGIESDPSNLVQTTTKPDAPTNFRVKVTVIVETQ